MVLHVDFIISSLHYSWLRQTAMISEEYIVQGYPSEILPALQVLSKP